MALALHRTAMSKCLINNWHLLHYLTDKAADKKLIRAILKNADKELLNSLSEVFFNLASGVPPLEPKLYNKLKVLFSKLADKSITNSAKKSLLIRTRKFWADPVRRAVDSLKNLCDG